MLNAIMLGLTTISSILGYNRYSYYDLENQDLIRIAEYSNKEIVVDSNGEIEIEGTNYILDLFTIEGENRYICFDFDDSFLIYDKKEDNVEEFKITQNNPYDLYKQNFCFYVEDNEIIRYGIVDETSYYSILDKKYLDEIIISNSIDNSSETGSWLTFENYGENTKKIDNYFYFEKLHDMHGSNTDGTCAIVAIQILLGYYDTFYNDYIIPENFDVVSSEVQSSIVLFEQSPGTNDSFHDYLIEYANSNEISSNGIGMDIYQEKDLTVNYLANRNIDYGYKWVEGNWADTTSNAASNHVKEAIDAGRPIFIGGAGHATVAYAYDDNYVYVHSGWGDIRRTPWSTYNTDLLDFWGGPHTVDITYINNHYHSDNYYSSNLEKYICPCGMSFNEQTVLPSDYKYEEQYFFYEKNLEVNVDGLKFNTKRLRTGYIEEEKINLSPRRTDAGIAYIEYYFTNIIRKIKVDLSFWSSSEYLYSSDSTLIFQFLDPITNEWVTNLDLLNDGELGTDRYNQKEYTFEFPNNTIGFRFYSTSSPTGDRNKGRLSIGDMIIIYN